MTPAALKALAEGNLENFRAASTPGGIEAQERAGQIKQSFEETLPKEGCERAIMEKLGFQFIGEGEGRDSIFWVCKFPQGWRKKPTEHSTWTDLLDGKGRKRGSIFFKAAFYDYHAHMNLEPAYRVRCNYGETHRSYSVIGPAGELLFEVTPVSNTADFAASEQANKECQTWIK